MLNKILDSLPLVLICLMMLVVGVSGLILQPEHIPQLAIFVTSGLVIAGSLGGIYFIVKAK